MAQKIEMQKRLEILEKKVVSLPIGRIKILSFTACLSILLFTLASVTLYTMASAQENSNETEEALTTESETKITDNFDDGNAEGWEFETIANAPGPHTHEMMDGKLKLTNTRAVIGNPEWKNYSIEVRMLTLQTFNEGGHGSITFRRVKSDNRIGMGFYLMYIMPAQKIGVLDVIHPETGEHDPQSQIKGEFLKNKWYNLKLVVEGNNIKGYIDNEIRFNVHNDTIQRGNVALESWCAEVLFDDFKLTLINK